MQKEKVSVFWFRRDLRLEDNHGLSESLKSPYPVLPIFIFDTEILDELDKDDARVTFIYDKLELLAIKLKKKSTSLCCWKGNPAPIWKRILDDFDVHEVHANDDYEPYAIIRDKQIKSLLSDHDIPFNLYKDQVIFEKEEIVKADGSPYTVYTPYKNKWLNNFSLDQVESHSSESENNFLNIQFPLPTLSEIGFSRSATQVIDYDLDHLESYEETRNIPALNKTSHLSPHLRFGTISIRQVIKKTFRHQTFINELIWREFFMQILYHFPYVVQSNFKRKYDLIEWRNDPNDFKKWKKGETGYPIVDAGIRELNSTGYMHNRVRMVVAGFLCKHLLIDWRWGEAYFAKKLLDYELSSNNGNWQWSAGTGCDAAPYFRIFNPTEQVKKFDPDLIYIKKWIPEINTQKYPDPMVDHKMARERAIETYKRGLQQNKN
jgi:deoxyribodipyrimidine photo-lyase